MFFSPIEREDVNRRADVGAGAKALADDNGQFFANEAWRRLMAHTLHASKNKVKFLNRMWP